MDDKGPVYRAKMRLLGVVIVGLVLFFAVASAFGEPYV